jgi:hypothetical protein
MNLRNSSLLRVEVGEVRGGHEADLLVVPRLELDRRLVHDLVVGEDLRLAAYGERDRVRRPGVDLDLLPVLNDGDLREVRVLAELCDGHADDLTVQLRDDLRQEVVRHRTGRARALELHEDRRGLRVADPDRQEAVLVHGLQQHDRLLADRLEAHAVEGHLTHAWPEPV